MFGGNGDAVEVDETYFGQRKGMEKVRGGHPPKLGILAPVLRVTCQMRTFTFDKFRADKVLANFSREARLMTQEARMYSKIGKQFAEHGTTLHGIRQYVHPACRSHHSHQHCRKRVLDFQAWHEGRVSALWRTASASLSGRV